jgi:hypothetical protein
MRFEYKAVSYRLSAIAMTSGAKARSKNGSFIAALKRLRHPKAKPKPIAVAGGGWQTQDSLSAARLGMTRDLK